MVTDLELAKYCLKAYDKPNLSCNNGAEALIEAKGEDLIIAFSGTDSLLDALIDLWAIPWRPNVLGEWVHRGVWKQTSCLIDLLMPKIPKGSDIYVTGHSLGGAMAQVFAAYLHRKGYEVQRLTTFGSMKPGYEGLADLLWETPGKRYVRDGDQVTELPLSTFLFPYCFDRIATVLPGSPDLFGDHSMEGYLESLTYYDTI